MSGASNSDQPSRETGPFGYGPVQSGTGDESQRPLNPAAPAFSPGQALPGSLHPGASAFIPSGQAQVFPGHSFSDPFRSVPAPMWDLEQIFARVDPIELEMYVHPPGPDPNHPVPLNDLAIAQVARAVARLLDPPNSAMVIGGHATVDIGWAVPIVGVEHFEMTGYHNNRLVLRRDMPFIHAREFGLPEHFFNWLLGADPGHEGPSEWYTIDRSFIRRHH